MNSGSDLRGPIRHRNYMIKKFEKIRQSAEEGYNDQQTTELVQLWNKASEEGEQSKSIAISQMKKYFIMGGNPIMLDGKKHQYNNAYATFLLEATKFWNAGYRSIKDNSQSGICNKKIFAIALDGGGIRGLISSVILRFVAGRMFGNDEGLQKKFQWFIGTSKGMLIDQ